jgi:hypothetical protein
MKQVWWKLLTGYAFYFFFHEINSWFPNTLPGLIFGEHFESVYTHMKMLFYAYMVVALIDYIVHRKTIKLEAFVYARMLILSSVPWMMIVMYYVFEAASIPLGNAELYWGIFMTLIGIYFSIRLEEPFEAMPLRGGVKALIAVTFVSSLITYTGFSFHVPNNFFDIIE